MSEKKQDLIEKRKQIAFDLDTKALRRYYPTPNWNNAYEDIKRHMKKNGFSWEQGSTYLSNNPMTSRQVTRILNDLIRKYPWTIQCMKRCSETDEPPRNRDRMTLFRNAIKAHKKTYTMEEWKKKIAERKVEKEKSAVPEANEKIKVKTEKDRSE